MQAWGLEDNELVQWGQEGSVQSRNMPVFHGDTLNPPVSTSIWGGVCRSRPKKEYHTCPWQPKQSGFFRGWP